MNFTIAEQKLELGIHELAPGYGGTCLVCNHLYDLLFDQK